MSFKETCDTFDKNLWGVEWAAPVPRNGVWEFNLPAKTDAHIHAVRKTALGFGTVKWRMKVSGPKVANTNYYVFLYAGNGNELDCPEIYGSHKANELSISSFHDGQSNYSFFDSTKPFEDKNWHDFEFTLKKGFVELKVDGVVQYYRAGLKQLNPATIAEAPMQLFIGGNSKPTSAAAWSFYIDDIEFIPESVAPAPVPTPTPTPTPSPCEAELEEAKNEIAALQSELDSANLSISDDTIKIISLNDQVSDLASQVQALQSEKSLLQQKISMAILELS